jgi:hypothetical protein
MTNLLSIAALCAGALIAVPAAAQGTWNLGEGGCDPSGGVDAWGKNVGTSTCTMGTVTATMSAWSAASSGSAFTMGAVLNDQDPNGFGVYSGRYETSSGGHHAFDNVTSGCSGNNGVSGLSTTTNGGCGGAVEAMLIDFGSTNKLNLTSLSIGWWSGDADISVYRWDGGALGANLGGATANLSTGALSGWTLVSSADVDGSTSWTSGATKTFNLASGYNASGVDADKYSSYFLITTYFGASTNGLGGGNDKFKLLNFAANVCTQTLSGGGGNGSTCGPGGGGGNNVPEPASLALTLVALAGLGISRRRRTDRKA